MEVDVAVLGGGPGGYTAAIRAAQLGAKVACIEKEPELGGTCLRVGCIPTKAWVQTAHFLHQANETFGKLGVSVSDTKLDFGAANEWKNGVVKQMTGGVAGLLKANGVAWVKGYGKFTGREHDLGRGRRGRQLQAGDRRDRVVPDAPADSGARVGSLRRLDRPALADRGAEAPRDPRRRHHRLRVRLDLQPLRLRGDGRRDARHADPAGRRRRGQGACEGLRQAWHQAAARQAVHEGRAEGQFADRALRRRRIGRLRPDARVCRPCAARRGGRARSGRRRVRQAQGHYDRCAPPNDGRSHLCGRRLRRLLAAGAHGVPRR